METETVTGGKMRLTIWSFNAMHRKEYLLNPSDCASSLLLLPRYAKPGSKCQKDDIVLYRIGTYGVMLISSKDEPPHTLLERLPRPDKIAWFPFGMENVCQVGDTRQMRDIERLASCNGFHIVPTEQVEAYAHILEGLYHTY